MFRKRGLILLMLFVILAACSPKDQGKTIKAGDPQDFTLTSLDGEEFTLSELRGNVVLVDFWATWCPPCRRSIPAFINLFNKYYDKGFFVLGISRENSATLEQYRNDNGIPYPILIDDKNVAKEYGVKAIPHIFIIDKKGRISKSQVGFAPEIEAMFDTLVDSLLNE